jgi:hypothetical protein
MGGEYIEFDWILPTQIFVGFLNKKLPIISSIYLDYKLSSQTNWNTFTTINLNSVDSVNIDTNTVAIKASKVALGDKNASEPIILGDKFLEDFSELCQDLNSVAVALQSGVASALPENPPLLSLISPVVALANSSGNMLSKIKQYKSTVTTTK